MHKLKFVSNRHFQQLYYASNSASVFRNKSQRRLGISFLYDNTILHQGFFFWCFNDSSFSMTVNHQNKWIGLKAIKSLSLFSLSYIFHFTCFWAFNITNWITFGALWRAFIYTFEWFNITWGENLINLMNFFFNIVTQALKLLLCFTVLRLLSLGRLLSDIWYHRQSTRGVFLNPINGSRTKIFYVSFYWWWKLLAHFDIIIVILHLFYNFIKTFTLSFFFILVLAWVSRWWMVYWYLLIV